MCFLLIFVIISKDFVENSGAGLLSKYQGSPSKLLEAIFPQDDWKLWLFEETPKGFWADVKNHRNFLEWLGNKLEFKNKEDWYKLTREVALSVCFVCLEK